MSFSFNKVTYENGVTVIYAENLNAIQDAIEYLLGNGQVDNTIIVGSPNAVSGGAVFSALANKVDVVAGKGLSTEDFTTAEKQKLTALPTAAQLNTNMGTKVDKLTTAGEKVYTHNGSVQGEKAVTATPTEGAVVLYGAGGRLKASAPAADNDVLRKKEQDDLVAGIEAGTEATANYHLGFYLDAEGDLCQVENE